MVIAFLVLGLLLAVGGIAYLVYQIQDFLKNPTESALAKKELIRYFLSVIAIALGVLFLVASLFLSPPEWQALTAYKANLFAGDPINYSYQFAFALIGGFFFAVSNALLWSAFRIYYWKIKLEKTQKKLFAYLLWGDIPFAILFFLMMTEGFAPYLSYPLVNGFSITGSGWLWTTSADIANYKPLHIAFYGIIMLFGVCVSYWVCDHKFYQEFQ